MAAATTINTTINTTATVEGSIKSLHSEMRRLRGIRRAVSTTVMITVVDTRATVMMASVVVSERGVEETLIGFGPTVHKAVRDLHHGLVMWALN